MKAVPLLALPRRFGGITLHAIVAGKVRLGIKIPQGCSRRILASETAESLILVDGSESSMAAEAVQSR